ncbi:Os09g0320000 [Oryza sativa Japonica Group]|uniref:Os09g0320000 protein n=2 Tax=Oryza sativa subsp. japonica TaxID=39947 RepID=Q69M66_ORYSJ|nr:hypothetical protein [Oryza sativa Japonica Group]BAT07429.1 Os09g0320000 [Oryza sativa Japonica Group]
MPDLVPPGRGEARSAAAASLGGRIRRGDKAAAAAGDKAAAGGATPRPGLPPHHLPRGDEGAVGEVEREDAAVRA